MMTHIFKRLITQKAINLSIKYNLRALLKLANNYHNYYREKRRSNTKVSQLKHHVNYIAQV